MFLLRLVILTPTPPVSPPEVFLRPAVEVGYPVAAVAAKHPSLLSLGRVPVLSVTMGTKQARAQEVLVPSLGEDRGGKSPETKVVDKLPARQQFRSTG